MNKFDLGIIGLGLTGKEHLSFYLKKKDINKIYVSDIKKIKKNQKLYKIDKKLSEFSNSKNNKILSISNYDKDHAKLILKNYSKSHIFVEKPMCRTIKDLKDIHKIVKKNKFKNLLYSNLVLRSAKVFNKVIKQIRSGKFGKIYYFEGDYLYGRLNKIIQGWRGLDQNYSVFLGGGIHMVDLMIRFLNELPISVTSQSNKIVTRNNKFKFKDFVQSTYFFKNGALGKITANFGCVHKHQHVLKVYGTKKTFIYDDMGARISNKRDPHKSNHIILNKKLYKGKDCLLPEVLTKLQTQRNFKKEVYNELNLISASIHADISSKRKKKIKIKYLK
ncbi:MAG: hypothetical protein CMI79_05770 [Candidatus Pelagibacter sp.]|nr:hypothetical protein [Candidatus Pelagibacter sp.]|tara:strand:+ start:8264 stop:9259 length:996 start_codon:yes stop_codon:yes gene_type:complete